jgi:hypothetical protein
MDSPGAERPQTDNMQGDVPQGIRKDSSRTQQRWPDKLRWSLGLGCTAALIIGTSLLYRYSVPERSLAHPEAVSISADPAPTSPQPGGSAVRVLVDARLGTVLIEFQPELGVTPAPLTSPANAQSGAVRCAVALLSEAGPICAGGASPGAQPAAHLPAIAASGTFGRCGACPSGRGSAASLLSR